MYFKHMTIWPGHECNQVIVDKLFSAASGGYSLEGCGKAAVGGSSLCTAHGGGKRFVRNYPKSFWQLSFLSGVRFPIAASRPNPAPVFASSTEGARPARWTTVTKYVYFFQYSKDFLSSLQLLCRRWQGVARIFVQPTEEALAVCTRPAANWRCLLWSFVATTATTPRSFPVATMIPRTAHKKSKRRERCLKKIAYIHMISFIKQFLVVCASLNAQIPPPPPQSVWSTTILYLFNSACLKLQYTIIFISNE